MSFINKINLYLLTAIDRSIKKAPSWGGANVSVASGFQTAGNDDGRTNILLELRDFDPKTQTWETHSTLDHTHLGTKGGKISTFRGSLFIFKAINQQTSVQTWT